MDKIATLKEMVLEGVPPVPAGHWTLAALEEVCEKIIQDQPDLPLGQLVQPAQMGFVVALNLMQSLLDASFQNADQVTLNYRGQTFVLTRQSKGERPS